MKIFWSWQSDTGGKTGRHFVRNVLESAIEELSSEPLVSERPDMQLDHDRLGLTGSPDLAPAIYAKIRQASVFVADVTIVGVMEVHGKTPKPIINNNVALELGYAVGVLGDESILMVQNVHYGRRDDLPFDLRGKAGPIEYSLAPTATSEEMGAEAKALRRRLKTALRSFLPALTVVQTALLKRNSGRAPRYASREASDWTCSARRAGLRDMSGSTQSAAST